MPVLLKIHSTQQKSGLLAIFGPPAGVCQSLNGRELGQWLADAGGRDPQSANVDLDVGLAAMFNVSYTDSLGVRQTENFAYLLLNRDRNLGLDAGRFSRTSASSFRGLLEPRVGSQVALVDHSRLDTCNASAFPWHEHTIYMNDPHVFELSGEEFLRFVGCLVPTEGLSAP